MAPFLYASLTLYALASAVYLAFVIKRHDALARLARWTLLVAWLAHLALIGSSCLRGAHPLRDTTGAFDLTGWLIVGGYLAATLKWRLSAAGAIVGLLAFSLAIGGRMAAPADVATMVGALGRVHLVLVAVGVAAFALAAVLALLYVLQESALRSRRLGALYRLTPPLNTLDGVSGRLIDLGFPVFTLAVLSGVVWASRLPAPLGLRVEHVLGLGIWLVFAGLVLARHTIGVSGRRAALLTLVGFAATALVLVLYAVRRMGGA
jgi:ABC-type uncharacterized transport system permease subunit